MSWLKSEGLIFIVLLSRTLKLAITKFNFVHLPNAAATAKLVCAVLDSLNIPNQHSVQRTIVSTSVL